MNTNDIVDKIKFEIRVEIHLARVHMTKEGLELLTKAYIDFAMDNIERNLGGECFHSGFDGCTGTYELCIEKAITDDEEYLRTLKCNECGRHMKIETFEDYCRKAEVRELRNADKNEEYLEGNAEEIKELKEQIAGIEKRSGVLKDRTKEHKRLARLYRWK